MARPIKKPGIQWFISINKHIVERDLENNLDIKILIPSSLIEGFINWCANKRIKYEADIKQEIKDYLKDVYAKNLSWLNNKKGGALFSKVSERDGCFCKICKCDKDLTLDHIKPRSKNGSDSIENLQILCRSCNSKKGNHYGR